MKPNRLQFFVFRQVTIHTSSLISNITDSDSTLSDKSLTKIELKLTSSIFRAISYQSNKCGSKNYLNLKQQTNQNKSRIV